MSARNRSPKTTVSSPGIPVRERREGGAHVGFVLVVRGARRDQNLLERQAEGLGLPPEQRAANPVHADPVVFGRHRGEERRHAVAPVALDLPQRERAVLAAAPRDEDGLGDISHRTDEPGPRARPRGRNRDGGARRATPRGSPSRSPTKAPAHEERTTAGGEVLHILVLVIEQVLDPAGDGETGRATPGP